MAPSSVERVILAAQTHFNFSPEIEITLEANPTSSSENKLKNFIQSGVNRFSIGVQGLDSKKLAFLGREHSATEAIQTVEYALKHCKNVNLDLIYGFPDQTITDWEKQLKWAVGVGTQHISAYQLTIEQNTAFYSLFQRGKLSMPSEDIQADFYEATTNLLEAHDYQHYEISNYCKLNQHSKHNMHVWNYHEYIGIGAGAHGRITDPAGKLHATQGKKMPHAFLAPVTSEEERLAVDEILSVDQIAVENIIMSLRTLEGVNKSAFEQRCGFSLDNALNLAEKHRLIQLGALSESKSHLVLNKDHWILLDQICTNLVK